MKGDQRELDGFISCSGEIARGLGGISQYGEVTRASTFFLFS